VPESIQYILIGSPEAYSGKSAIILGLAYQLQAQGISIAYGKPLGNCLSESNCDGLDEDVRFITKTLNLSATQVRPTLRSLDKGAIAQRIQGEDEVDYQKHLHDYNQFPGSDLVMLEGPATLEEGRLFNLSIPQIAESVNATVLLVTRYHNALVVDALLAARQTLGDRLIGLLINDVPTEQFEQVDTHIRQFLEAHHIPVLGILPRNALLRSVSVDELRHQLKAEVLCRADRMDLMVESLKIGAMNVSAALKYFSTAHNMAVVTGGDRTDIQLAALETSTQCLILTGQIPPSSTVISRAEELEVPILSVDLDTLTTVEIIDRAFGQVRFHEPVKMDCVHQLMSEHFDIARLMQKLELPQIQ